MPRPKSKHPLTKTLRAIRVTPKMLRALKGVQRVMVEEAGGAPVTIAEVQRRLMLRGLAVDPKPPALSPAVDEAL